MVNVRPHSGDSDRHPPAGGTGHGCSLGGRLNLLLSHAGWQQDPWVDRLPRLLEPMGIVSHRADSARQATTIINSTRIHIAVVDLALPLDPALQAAPPSADEAGPKLLELLNRLAEPPPTIVIKRARSHRDDQRELSAALRAGVFAVLDRPADTASLNNLLDAFRRCLDRHYRGCWPGSPPQSS